MGPNTLPRVAPPSLVAVFLRQFLSPLIYILLAAAVVSLMLGDLRDAFFIGIVLLVNGVIGTVQEHTADQAAAALRRLEQPATTVIRDGAMRTLDAVLLVPGDIVLLEAGNRVPADVRLIEGIDLQCDESLLTGESMPVRKSPRHGSHGAPTGTPDAVHAGTVVTRGRGTGVVVATGAATQLGRIAGELGRRSLAAPPLLVRLEHFSRRILLAIGAAVVVLVLIGWLRHMPWTELFMMSVGLAVSAIPEGLPVAISVTLAIGMRRMARANVVVRKMPAVESLGSCTLIASDKTGTLTLNELVVTDIRLPDGTALSLEVGSDLEHCAIRSASAGRERRDEVGQRDAAGGGEGSEGSDAAVRQRVAALLRAATLPNEARLSNEGNGWSGIGDTVDIALLAAAHKGGAPAHELRDRYPLVARIPYEPDRRYAASFHRHVHAGRIHVFVKGAPETLIDMCDRADMHGRAVPIHRDALLRQKQQLATRGLRVLAFAEGTIDAQADGAYGHGHLVNLTFLGMVGMQDPVRPEVPRAIRSCYDAGIEVVMVTGDDPATAAAIAAQAGLRFDQGDVVTGDAVRQALAQGDAALDTLTRRARIYARVSPEQKLAIVLSLARIGHFVAVTGDGVNDAPALKHAHVGVAMGRKGTEVAKESADIVITDDNFASIVNGIREGRVAYANIRKLIFMLVSTGAAEVVLFLLAMPFGLPMPLLPVQLLWLNLVTNGIQDVALATEHAEGDELCYPPRRPREPIFDRMMVRRICVSMLIMGGGGFVAFYWLLHMGRPLDEARNLLLLLFVLFENVQTFNSRSERHSVLHQGFLANPFLVISVLAAQGVHIAAMYLPGLREVLGLAPVPMSEWIGLLLIAVTLMLAVDLDKWWWRRRGQRSHAGVN
ncbi:MULTISPECIES: cation-translocating P-type ATPase [unclassified Cupriavidus]|uniref:cation-translocating P-type ATPase n=1 Tax=Cupriavidus sp. H19C3 TaxID=3241603 RepID=UPI003BF7F1E7